MKTNRPISEDEFIQQFNLLNQMAGANPRHPLNSTEILPILNERDSVFNFDGHYVYHMGWAAELLGNLRPKKHVDIGSHHHFSLIVSGFIPTTFLDYRPFHLNGLNGFSSDKCDLTATDIPANSISSLSCMHVIEHIGLGRYGDTLDYNGDIQAAKMLTQILAPSGDLLIVVPVGRPRMVFNAHRIYDAEQVLSMFSELTLKEFSLIPDNFITTGIQRHVPIESTKLQNYGCGCFWFRKPSINEFKYF